MTFMQAVCWAAATIAVAVAGWSGAVEPDTARGAVLVMPVLAAASFAGTGNCTRCWRA